MDIIIKRSVLFTTRPKKPLSASVLKKINFVEMGKQYWDWSTNTKGNFMIFKAFKMKHVISKTWLPTGFDFAVQ